MVIYMSCVQYQLTVLHARHLESTQVFASKRGWSSPRFHEKAWLPFKMAQGTVKWSIKLYKTQASFRGGREGTINIRGDNFK
jgi:hypothetical protein